MPNPEGTPRSHLHMSQRKCGMWCWTFIPVPYWKATDVFQDNKTHVRTLFNMEIRYLNRVSEELCWTLAFAASFNTFRVSPDSTNCRDSPKHSLACAFKEYFWCLCAESPSTQPDKGHRLSLQKPSLLLPIPTCSQNHSFIFNCICGLRNVSINFLKLTGSQILELLSRKNECC